MFICKEMSKEIYQKCTRTVEQMQKKIEYHYIEYMGLIKCIRMSWNRMREQDGTLNNGLSHEWEN